MTWDDSDESWQDVLPQLWWAIVFEGEEWNIDEEMICSVIGPEYFFALDRGLQP
jgi:hypothetical protein